MEIPAFSVGETGAAAGLLSIAMLAFLHSKGVHKRPSLAALTATVPNAAPSCWDRNGQGRS